MPPQHTNPPKKPHIPIGKIVVLTSACAAMSSAVAVWLVLHFANSGDTKKDAVLTIADTPKKIAQVTIEPAPPRGAEQIQNTPIEAAQLDLPAIHIGDADLSTAATHVHNMMSALRDEYDVNPYFKNRTDLKQRLDRIFQTSRLINERLQRGASQDAVDRAMRDFNLALDSTVERLDYLLASPSNKDQSEAEITRLLKTRIEEIRSAFR
jgi:hypothetical protein